MDDRHQIRNDGVVPTSYGGIAEVDLSVSGAASNSTQVSTSNGILGGARKPDKAPLILGIEGVVLYYYETIFYSSGTRMWSSAPIRQVY
uniref:Uncharacterized protein n=1 Tax=Parascaris equorum TaxID=6256 RepID=A0A914RGN7_PAREQ